MNPLNVVPQVLVLTLAAALVLFSGCSRKTAQDRVVDSAARQYGRISSGMTKREVIASLGQPVSRQGSRYRWESQAGPQNLAAIEVQFDRADKVASIARTRASDR